LHTSHQATPCWAVGYGPQMMEMGVSVSREFVIHGPLIYDTLRLKKTQCSNSFTLEYIKFDPIYTKKNTNIYRAKYISMELFIKNTLIIYVFGVIKLYFYLYKLLNFRQFNRECFIKTWPLSLLLFGYL
jgi:hypothetical protein